MTTNSTTASTLNVANASLGSRVLAGLVGGATGGLVFGALMSAMGMLPMIASMVGSNSLLIGFGIHMIISILIGLVPTVIFGNTLLSGYPRGALVGTLYGALWWVLGPLLVMPMMLGMPPFIFDSGALLSLMGHLVYGMILGVVAAGILSKRRR